MAWGWPLMAISAALLMMACSAAVPTEPQPTPDYHALETRVEAMLEATYTAMAPPPTDTPQPQDTWTPTPDASTPEPMAAVTPTPQSPGFQIAYVQHDEEGESSIVLEGALPGDSQTLQHLTGTDEISALGWSPDGEWLFFVSGHDSLLSKANERNLFRVREDGSGLEMLTGAHVPAAEAPGPYMSLEGRVTGGGESCLVSAQGVSSPMTVDEDGSFSIPGVPLGATWARAVCTIDGHTLSGGVELSAEDGQFPPIEIPVAEGGQGWRQVDVSRDGAILAGTYYQWGPAAEEEPTAEAEGDTPAADNAEAEAEQASATMSYSLWGRIMGLTSGYTAELERGPDGNLDGLDWSPVDDRLVGAVTGGDGGWLWLWDVTGASLGELFTMPNPDDQILTLANPAWSPDGSQVVFEVRRWYWWSEDKYRTDLMIVSGDGQRVEPLVTLDWGEHATVPGWLLDKHSVVYQYSRTEPDQELSAADNGSIWVVDVNTGQMLPWTSGPQDYAPAPNPAGKAPEPTPQPTAGTN